MIIKGKLTLLALVPVEDDPSIPESCFNSAAFTYDDHIRIGSHASCWPPRSPSLYGQFPITKNPQISVSMLYT